MPLILGKLSALGLRRIFQNNNCLTLHHALKYLGSLHRHLRDDASKCREQTRPFGRPHDSEI